MKELASISTFQRGAALTINWDEQNAIDGLRKLDAQAMARIYDRYFPEIYRYIVYRISDKTASEDIASDVFMRLLEAAQAGRGPRSNIKSWLIGTASHAVTDHLRRKYRRPEEAISDSLPDIRPGLQVEFDQREQQREIHHAYNQLTPEQQDVLALRFGQGYSLEETASLLNKNVNAVKALQFRALAALQRQIGEVIYE